MSKSGGARAGEQNDFTPFPGYIVFKKATFCRIFSHFTRIVYGYSLLNDLT